MKKEIKWIVAAGVTVFLSSSLGFEGLAAPGDGEARGRVASNEEGKAPSFGSPGEGEARAAEYYRQNDRCVVVMQYGEKPGPIGPMTGDPEKDTYAYSVKHTDNVCAKARP